MLTQMAKEQVEEGKYATEPQKCELDKIKFVLQGGKVPDRKKAVPDRKKAVSDRKKANKARESQSGVKWEVAADLKGSERFFPIPTTKNQTW